jgi:hypothetical protein
MCDITEFILSIDQDEEKTSEEQLHSLCSTSHPLEECDCMCPDDCDYPQCYCGCPTWEATRSLKNE